MNVRNLIRISLLFSLFAFVSAGRAEFTAPTPEELKMTSQPEVPGAAAVYLNREEITDDKLHSWSVYARIKILSDSGKELANQELRQYRDSEGDGYTVSDIQGRTIHADGTIIPFTGKPFEKLIEKTQGYQVKAKIFTLPSVEVGSIIEYRYVLGYNEDIVYAPKWLIQSDLYTRKAHYIWRPTNQIVTTLGEHGEELDSTISWTPILPKGFEVKQTTTTGFEAQTTLELNIHDIPPIPDEEYMPPMGGLTYRVLFYYSPYKTVDEFWKNEGRSWSKDTDKFIGPGPKVKDAATKIVSDADSSDVKLRKIYAAVLKLENTSYTRERSAAEDKAGGLAPPKSTDDIWDRKRGNDDQLAELFVAFARAAGFKAYVMGVTNRDEGVFVRAYFSLSQIDDYVAIVNVDGNDLYFDPGQPFCTYGQLAWKHTFASGLRQTDGGSAIAETPGATYKDSRVQRVAELTMDEHGGVTGTVKMSWSGAPALSWRQRASRGDDASLERDLRTYMEHTLPGGMEVKVGAIVALKEHERPLSVTFDVKGQLAASTGKRFLIPGDIFEANTHPTFPHDKRELPVYFHFPEIVQDAIRISFPASLGVESVPAAMQLPLQKLAVYNLTTESTPTSITIRREFDLGDIIFKTDEYPDLRAFYNKLETKDQEPIVLKAASAASSGN